MARPLTGKVALATGGSRGIGAAIVGRPSPDGGAVAFAYAASAERAEMLAAAPAASGASVATVRADG